MKKLSLIAWLLVILLALPSWALATSVYYMPATNPAQNAAITGALSPFYSVTTGAAYTAFDGSQATLGNFNVVLFSGINSGDMPLAGQAALKSFVQAGGGLITGEWVVYNAWSGWDPDAYFTTLRDVLPGQLHTDSWVTQTPSTYTQATANSVLNYNLPSSFPFPVTWQGGTESEIYAKTGAQTYYDSAATGAAGLVGGSYGPGDLGRVLNFSTLIGPVELGNPNYKQLLVNSVYWAAGNNAPVPIPGSVLLLGSGLIGLVGMRRFWKKG